MPHYLAKSVIQLDTTFNPISSYPSGRAASRATGVARASISACCLGRVELAGGFIWRFGGDTNEKAFDILSPSGERHVGTNLQQYLRNHPELIEEGMSAQRMSQQIRRCVDRSGNEDISWHGWAWSQKKWDKASKRRHPERLCVVCGNLFTPELLYAKDYPAKHSTRSPKTTCSEGCSSELRSSLCVERQSIRDMRTPEAIDKAAQTRTGVFATGRSARGEKHHKSKKYVFRSPDGVTYEGINITQFVRDHLTLFSKEDVAWKKSYSKQHYSAEHTGSFTCRASKGLLSIARGAKNSWKGWTA